MTEARLIAMSISSLGIIIGLVGVALVIVIGLTGRR